MKILILGIVTFFASALSAQVEIQVDGTGPDVAGTTIDFAVDQFTSAPYEVTLYVTNNTGSDEQWTVTRVRQDVPSTWNDQICWPPNCYPTSGDMYQTPNTPGSPAPTIVNGTSTTTNGENAIIKPLISPDGANGMAHYMYYITNSNGDYIDSVGIRYTYTVGVEEITPALSMTVAPNPASSYVKVKTNGVESTTVKMVDVLGNIALKETVMGTSKTINTENFRNGVYFVIVEAEGSKPITRKLIVRR